MTQNQYLELVKKVNQLRDNMHLSLDLSQDEEISEEILDNLKMQITIFEEANPSLISPNSPNNTIAGGVASGFVKHNRLPA